MQLIFLVINFRRAGKKSSKSTILHVKEAQIHIIAPREEEVLLLQLGFAGWEGLVVCWGIRASTELMGAVVTHLL